MKIIVGALVVVIGCLLMIILLIGAVLNEMEKYKRRKDFWEKLP